MWPLIWRSWIIRRLPRAVPGLAAVGLLTVSWVDAGFIDFHWVVLTLFVVLICFEAIKEDKPSIRCGRCGAFGWSDDFRRIERCPRCGHDRFRARGFWADDNMAAYDETGMVLGCHIRKGLFFISEGVGIGGDSDGGADDGGGDGGGGD